MYRTLVLSFCLVIVLGMTAFSQETNQQPTEDEVTAYPWSLQFRVTNDYLMTSFEGKSLSIKKQVSPTSAWRLGISPNFRFGSESLDSYNSIDTSGIIIHEDANSQDTDQDVIGIEIDFVYVKTISQSKPIYPYVGIGPMISYSYQKNKRTLTDSDDYNVNKYEEFRAGGTALCGVEWRFKKQFALFAEYAIDLYYRNRVTETESISVNGTQLRNTGYTRDDTSFNLGNSTVTTGLSLYF